MVDYGLSALTGNIKIFIKTSYTFVNYVFEVYKKILSQYKHFEHDLIQAWEPMMTAHAWRESLLQEREIN